MITVSQKAAEKIKVAMDDTGGADKFFRVAASPGCGGFQYQVGFDSKRENDGILDCNGANIIMDADSAAILDGAEIDFSNDSGSFIFHNPNGAPSCGCGSGCDL